MSTRATLGSLPQACSLPVHSVPVAKEDHGLGTRRDRVEASCISAVHWAFVTSSPLSITFPLWFMHYCVQVTRNKAGVLHKSVGGLHLTRARSAMSPSFKANT